MISPLPSEAILTFILAAAIILVFSFRQKIWSWLNVSSPLLERMGHCVCFAFCFGSMTTWAVLSTTLMIWDCFLEPTTRPKKGYTKTSHFYTDNHLFEQSLDVYTPTSSPDDKPMLVLVVGSGWAGHYKLLSAASNWWNSAGPKMVASSLGCQCICVRHRGGFPQFQARKVLVLNLVLHALLSLVLRTSTPRVWLATFLVQSVFLAVYAGVLALAARGSATIDDMMNDVATALKWIQDHHQKEHPKIWFGGYSSGAHVAALVLQRPTLLQEKKVDPLETWIQQIVFISGVLGVRPIEATETSPRFVTDFVNQCIFGHRHETLPSPLENLPLVVGECYPKLPHLILDCGPNEMLGLAWLDHYFVSPHYHHQLEKNGRPSKYIAMPNTNHWEVLGSKELKAALQKEITKAGAQRK